MKIIVYTINDCPFCKQEKDYFSTNKITFEEKNLETNKEFLTEMLAVSNNFAGTPVTKVEKDDGQIAVLKGFTKEEFDKVFGLETAPKPVAETNAKMDVPPAPAPTPTPPPTPIPTPVEPPKTETPEPVKVEPVSAEATTGEEKPAEQTNVAPDPLDAILNDLKTKSGEPTSAEATAGKEETLPPTPSPAPGTTPPTIPDFQSK